MPKKALLNARAVKELEMYFHDVEGPMFRLGVRLSRHFRETDDVRSRFIALENLFKAFAKDSKKQIALKSKMAASR
jgi:hypothetical protein